jgi:two-component system sensor histidine kinase UhpB
MIVVMTLFISIFPKSNKGSSTIDSLKIILSGSLKDTIRVSLLTDISKNYVQQGKYDLCRKYGEEALLLAKKIDFKRGIATVYDNYGTLYWYTNKYDSAIGEYFKAGIIFKQLNDIRGIASVTNGTAIIYSIQGAYATALILIDSCIKMNTGIKDSSGLGSNYINKGAILQQEGFLSLALENYMVAIAMMEATGNKRGMAHCLMSIANLYSQDKKYDEALEKFKAALKMQIELNEKHSIADANMGISSMFINMVKDSEALIHANVALEIFTQLDDPSGKAQAYINIGIVNKNKKDYSTALHYYLESKKIFKSIGDKSSFVGSDINLAKIYLLLKQYRQAKLSLDEGLTLALQTGNKDDLKDIYRCLSEVDTSLSDYKSSLMHYKLYSYYKDSLYNENSSRQIAEMNVKYNAIESQKEIQLLTKDNELQTTIIRNQNMFKYYASGGFVLLIALFALIYKNYKNRQKLKIETLRNNIAADLHDDIGSTLNSISLFSEIAKKQAGIHLPALDDIGNSSRNVIDSMSDIVWTVNPDNDTFENTICRMRSIVHTVLKSKTIDFIFNADEALDKLALSMPIRKNLYLIFKEVSNNLVKYSLATKAFYSIEHKEDLVRMTITDNGVGFNTSAIHDGNGIKNIKRRAIEIGGQLMISSSEEGTQVQLVFKL